MQNLYTGIFLNPAINQTGIQLTGLSANVYFADDTLTTNQFTIAKIDTLGWTWGTSFPAGQYPSPPLPLTITTTIMSLTTAGILSFGSFANGIKNDETTINVGISAPFSLSGGGLSFRSFRFTTSAVTTYSTYNFLTMPINARYTIILYNGSTGNLIFNGQGTQGTAGAVRVGGGASANTFTIPTLRFCLCDLYSLSTQISALAVTNYFMNFTLM